MVNSIINDLIKTNIESLDAFSSHLLQIIDQQDVSHLDPSLQADIQILKQSFYDAFNLSTNLLSGSSSQTKNTSIQGRLSNSELLKSLSFSQNGSISKKITSSPAFKDLSPELKSDLQNLFKLEKLTLFYNSLLTYFLISQQLLTKTIPLSNDIDYYDQLLNSHVSFAIYILQLSPKKFYNLVKGVYLDLGNYSSDSVDELSPPAWLPVQLHHFYRRVMHFSSLLIQATKHQLNKIIISPSFFLLKNFQINNATSPRRLSYLAAILGTPFYSIRQEIITKKQNLVSLQRSSAVKLGLLLNQLPDMHKYDLSIDDSDVSINQIADFLDNDVLLDNITESIDRLSVVFEGGDPLEVDSSFSDIDSSFVKLNKLVSQVLPIHNRQFKTDLQLNRKPSLLVRYWILGLAGILYLPGTAATIYGKQLELQAWIQENLIDSVKGFYQNWIVKPFNQILATVRHDPASEVAIMSQKSLASDLDSLTRMVIDLATDNASGSANASELELLKRQITESVQAGDLTPIMLDYEKALKSPALNFVKGKLLRSLLIQIQKLKVDGEVAMTGIDKLLKSQELVFTVVAVSPSLLVVYYILSSLNQYWKNGATRFNSSLKPKILTNLNNVERFLILTNSQYHDFEIDGLILLEVIELRSLGLLVIPKTKRFEWIRDCNDLLDKDFTTEMKLRTLDRIHKVYKFYI